VGRGLRRGEFPIKTPLLSPALSSTSRRRGGRIDRRTSFETVSVARPSYFPDSRAVLPCRAEAKRRRMRGHHTRRRPDQSGPYHCTDCLWELVSVRARGLNIECGCFGTIGGQHVGLVNLAIDATVLFLAALWARRSKDCPAKKIFREAGAQNSAPPLEASPKASSATERGSRPFAFGETLR
jgi:hypothetical protein